MGATDEVHFNVSRASKIRTFITIMPDLHITIEQSNINLTK